MKHRLLLISSLLLVQLGSAVAAPEEGSSVEKAKLNWNFTPDPALPNVLILGDSISIGYTLKVRELLKGEANVYRPTAPNGKKAINCSDSLTGLRKLDGWLAGHQWAVIHFNWGLHDLKHVKVAGKHSLSDNPEDPQMMTIAQYSENLQGIVAKLKKTDAKLVFATITPVVPGTTNPLREPEAPGIYNAAALKVMKANDVQVNDLYAYCKPHLKEWQLPQNVHYNTQGSEAIAKEVASVIREQLGTLKTGKSESVKDAVAP